jgi:hypothetical protein
MQKEKPNTKSDSLLSGMASSQMDAVNTFASRIAETLQLIGDINMMMGQSLVELARKQSGQAGELQKEMASILSQTLTPGDMRALAHAQRRSMQAAVEQATKFQRHNIDWASRLLDKIHDAAEGYTKEPDSKA